MKQAKNRVNSHPLEETRDYFKVNMKGWEDEADAGEISKASFDNFSNFYIAQHSCKRLLGKYGTHP